MKTTALNLLLNFLTVTMVMFALNSRGQGNAGNNGSDKITICHIPPGNPGNLQTITISVNALEAHLAHGDHIGGCGDGKLIRLECMPNPYQEFVKIAYALTEKCNVKINIYNIYGSVLKTVANEEKEAGGYEEYFSGKELGLAGGVFLVKALAQSETEVIENSVRIVEFE